MKDSDKLAATLAMMSGDFENSNFENHADAISQLPPSTQMAIQKAVSQSGNGMIKHLGGGVDHSTWDSLIVNSKGDLNVTITRQGASLAGVALPFVLFGSNDFQDNYNATLRTFQLASGTTVTVTTDAATGDVLFTYVNGNNTDGACSQ